MCPRITPEEYDGRMWVLNSYGNEIWSGRKEDELPTEILERLPLSPGRYEVVVHSHLTDKLLKRLYDLKPADAPLKATRAWDA